jgi:hypothetical protein
MRWGLRGRNSRSLGYAPPDFLSNLLALANLMRLSLLKAAHAVIEWCHVQEIRVGMTKFRWVSEV